MIAGQSADAGARAAADAETLTALSKDKATVAVPVTFDMVRDGVGPADFTIGSKALEDALRRPDPWADFFKAAKPLRL